MEAKGFTLAILGDQGVGKTSFCNQYISKTFNEDEKPTLGAEYYQKIILDNNTAIKINIYCSSGNPKAKKIEKYLYKDARSIIIMFNVNKKSTFDNLNSYIENIGINSVEDPIIYLVGNFIEEAKAKRQITREQIKHFEEENYLKYNIKYFEISCKTGDGVNELMKELIKEILMTEKYFTSSIDKDISDLASQDNGEKDLERLSKPLKAIYKEAKDKRNCFFRCFNCLSLLEVKFKNNYNEISLFCHSCKTEENISMERIDDYFGKLFEKVICYQCLKTKEDKIKLEYCNKCRHFICPNCKKNIVKQLRAEGSEIHKLVPYYLMDIICYDHFSRILGYCRSCQKNICIKCLDLHKTHENIFYDDFLEKLKAEHKDELKKEMNNLNKFIKNYEDCIASIKKEVEKYISSKRKEIKLKEAILAQLSNIQYNQRIVESLRNMKYMKEKKYDLKLSWDRKLANIFEVIGQPIQIKNANIAKNHKNYITSTIIQINNNNEEGGEEAEEENNEKQPYSYNLLINESKEVTDFCSMNNDKFLGISFNNGILELYENIVKKRSPIYSHEIFENGEKIESIYKSKRNVHNFFFCGKEKIKNIEFFDGYKNKRTILEINENKKIYKCCLEQDNYIISSDSNNKIIIYDKSGNTIGDISNCIDTKGNKDIFSLNEIMNNIIYITFNKASNSSSISSTETERNTYLFNDVEESGMDVSVSRSSFKFMVEIGTKLLELEENTFKIIREHILSNGQEIIGAISEKLILIRDDNYNSVILFDAKTFKNSQRFNFELGEKPIFCSLLDRRNNLIDFVLVSEQMKMFQNIYDEDHRNLIEISGLKIKAETNYDDKEIIKEGKIIHIPFKGFVKYIGLNNLVVVNY